MLSQPSLRDAANPREFVERIAAAAKALPKGQWLEGGNWDQDRWGGEMPHKDWIDAVTPDTPVAVIRYALHMLFLNSRALKLAGIDRNTPRSEEHTSELQSLMSISYAVFCLTKNTQQTH